MLTRDKPALQRLVQRVIELWPEHARFLEASVAGRAPSILDVSESLAQSIFLLAEDEPGGIDALSADYRYLCEDIMLPEEIHFRRHGRYRLSNFEEANAECYANGPFMSRYMNGLLLSNVLWSNHAHAFACFANDYLDMLTPGARHLEIGPGHGLFLHFAASHHAVGAVTGWDVSPTSIAKTGHALRKLGARLQPKLVPQDMFKAEALENEERFDSVVMSEILEHLENPVAALRAANDALKPGGFVFVNVPANSPAPDHIYLFHGLQHAADVVAEAGLEVLRTQAFPMSGATLERAVKHKLAVTCVVIGRKRS